MVTSVTIIALLATIAVPRVSEQIDRARVGKAIGDIRALQADIDGYAAGHSDSLPASLSAVGRGGFEDPWGNPYVYTVFQTQGGGNANGSDGSVAGQARKDRFLVPLNTRYDLYSKGKDGASQLPLTAGVSQDDVLRANDGGFIGLGSNY
jgi:general secretion pathway protein G